MKCFVFTRSDGSTAVGYPCGPRFSGESEDEWVARMAAQDVPVVLSASAGGYPAGTEIDKRAAATLGAPYTQLPYSIILQSNVPADRSYRNAWEESGGLVRHNMPKARALHRDMVRRERVAALVQLDGQWMRETGKGDGAAAAAVEARRQAWRDAPADPRIDAAADVVALKAIALPAT